MTRLTQSLPSAICRADRHDDGGAGADPYTETTAMNRDSADMCRSKRQSDLLREMAMGSRRGSPSRVVQAQALDRDESDGRRRKRAGRGGRWNAAC